MHLILSFLLVTLSLPKLFPCSIGTTMKTTTLIITAVLLIALAGPTHAQWPTILKQNLPVAAQPHVIERYPQALPYTSGRTLVIFDYYSVYDFCCQIISRTGELTFPNPQPLAPALIPWGNYEPDIIPDGAGGVIASWGATGPEYEQKPTPNSWIRWVIACGGILR
jgi:hypothetical protein